MAGYSATPLAKKLGIKDGSKLFLSNAVFFRGPQDMRLELVYLSEEDRAPPLWPHPGPCMPAIYL